jgi:hypothetical protein|nr:MAG TPA: Protein of unknown function (DUF2500) [Crassvirales sp.]
MRDLLIFLSIFIPWAVCITCAIKIGNIWNTEKQDQIYTAVMIVSGLILLFAPFTIVAITAPESNAEVVDKTFVPSGYMYNWDAKQLEQRIERRETRYYFIVRKDDGRVVEERVDSATYVKTDVGERILVD